MLQSYQIFNEKKINKKYSVCRVFCWTFPKITFGMHLHSNPNTATEKINAAYEAGCRRIDTALRGFGGCPMAKDDLVGNIATEKVLAYFKEKDIDLGLNMDKFNEALKYSLNIFH